MKWDEPRLAQKGITPRPYPMPPGRFLNWRSWITHGIMLGFIRGFRAAVKEFRLTSQI